MQQPGVLAARVVELTLKRTDGGVPRRDRSLQFADSRMRLLQRLADQRMGRAHRIALTLRICLRLSGFSHLGLRVAAQCRQSFLRRALRRRPQRRHEFAGRSLQRFRKVWMFDTYPALVPQIFPELVERLGRRTHAALAHELVQLVGGWRDAVTEKQQYAGFAVQVLRLRELLTQLVDIGQQLFFVKVGHNRDGRKGLREPII
ncbi:hypothetical protein TSA66_03320 [Noviherbaspirillum autotrophicum]|uniref:Uncharacterized protein n=1 Tax=Noviherbaspirillum autotrophicum TaxID=709839 RepID=A0A0C1YHT5_9BURK|nr:hypothetical protein TSA66_03320 [Noviherbaspirillum autotrophicum]